MAADRRVHWPASRLVALLGVWGASLLEPHVAEGQPVLVADPKFGGKPGVLWRLEDLNHDGDADDPGERTVFRDAAGADILTDDFTDVAWSRSGVVYALDSARGRVLKLQDLNGDGDAQDPAEATVFRDGTAEGIRLQAPASVAVSQTRDTTGGELQDVVYVYDPQLQGIARLQDRDGDGDAQGGDEICLFHVSIIGQPLTAMRMTTDDSGRLLAADPNRRAVIRAIDVNGDCNASVRPPKECLGEVAFNEYHVVKDPTGVGLDLVQPMSIAFKSENDLIFVAKPGPIPGPTRPAAAKGTPAGAQVFLLRDLTDDEDAQDADEVRLFSDGICGDLQYFTTTALAVDKAGRLYMSDFFRGSVLLFEDRNGDLDALDPDECHFFATGIGGPAGLAIQPTPFPALAVKADTGTPDLTPVSGLRDLGKRTDLLLPEGATAAFTLRVEGADPNVGVPDMKVDCDAIAGCLQCTPRSARTDAGGRASFKVSRVGPPTGDEGLVVSTLGDSLSINVTPFIPFECPFAALLERDPEGAAKTKLLHTLRDDVLARNRQGERYIELFKRHSLELTMLLLKDRELRQRAEELFTRLLPVLQARLAEPAAGGVLRPRPALTRGDVAEVQELMDAVAANASPELRSTMAQLTKELRAGWITNVMGIRVTPGAAGGAQGSSVAEPHHH